VATVVVGLGALGAVGEAPVAADADRLAGLQQLDVVAAAVRSPRITRWPRKAPSMVCTGPLSGAVTVLSTRAVIG
jgi:hypothetical protein